MKARLFHVNVFKTEPCWSFRVCCSHPSAGDLADGGSRAFLTLLTFLTV